MSTPEVEPGPRPGRIERAMPDFAMPDAVMPGPTSPEPATEPEPEPRPEPTPQPDPSTARAPRLEGPRERRRHLLAAALIGVLVGMVVPGSIGAAEQLVARSRADGLRATASAYLAAIADGRSDDASALVPLPLTSDPGARDAVADALEAAHRIRGAAVPFVHVEGPTGLAVVRYRLADRTITRTLEAEEVDGAWRFVGSLAEPVVVQRVQGGIASLAGTELAGATVRLYPGVYRFDAVTDDLVALGGNAFEVDGDPSTRTEAVAGARVVPAVHDRAVQAALAASAACQQHEGCVLAPDAAVRAPVGATLVGSASGPGAIDVIVPIEAVLAGAERSTELRIRITADERGDPAEWLCSAPGAPGGALAPCP